MTPAQPFLELADLHASYGQLTVLHGVNIEVGRAESVALVGANGAGKTTILRAISRMVRTRGTLRLEGRSLANCSAEQVVRLGIAHVPQGRGTLPNLTVEENMCVGAYLLKRRDVSDAVSEWYERFPELASRRRQRAGSLSGGEQQMLAICRAMLSKPALLLLDEPSLGLAPLVIDRLFEQLADIRSEHSTAMLLVEQNAELALQFAHRGYVLESGLVALSGPSPELAVDERVRLAYLGV
jgi:branched-chain amino acid transport system ATP-binding protein